MRPLGIVQGRPRLFISLVGAVLVGFALPGDWRPTTQLLVAWNAGTWFYFGLVGLLIAKTSHQSLLTRAAATDDGKFAILILTILAASVSLGAIFAELAGSKESAFRSLHVGLAAATIVSAWIFIHLTFALHYAHEYFDQIASTPGQTKKDRGGLIFPGTENPDYFDFLYFSFVIGVASQTADVAVSTKAMRRTALVHCVVAFFFNTAVLALTINIAASLI